MNRRNFLLGACASAVLTIAAVQSPQAQLLYASAPLLSITRAQISNTTINFPVFMVSGFSTIGDLGVGAVYTSNGAMAGGPMAIQSRNGIWYNLLVGTSTNVGFWGAKGDGLTDDRPSAQAATDYILTLSPSAPKAVEFPSTASGYLFNSGQTPAQKYPNTSSLSTALNCIYAPNAKNLTFRGVGAGRSILKVSNFVASSINSSIFALAQEINWPALTWNPSSNYHSSILSLQTVIAPVEVGTNWVKITQGAIALFPVGDIVYLHGGTLVQQYEKIIAVDVGNSIIYFENPINPQFGWINFPVTVVASAGATTIFVGNTNFFNQIRAENNAAIVITLADNSTLSTSVTGVGSSNQGPFITIANAIPGGKSVSVGGNIAIGSNTSLSIAVSETAFKSICAGLVTGGGVHVYPFVSSTDMFWGVAVENVVFENLDMQNVYNSYWISGAYDIASRNCVVTSPNGTAMLLGVINGFQIQGGKIEQMSGASGGLQLTPASTKRLTLSDLILVAPSVVIAECCEDIAVINCAINANINWNPSGPFLSIAEHRNVYFSRTRVSAGGGYAAGGNFIQVARSDNPYILDSVLFEKCDLECAPGLTGGVEAASNFLLNVNNAQVVTVKDSIIRGRLFNNFLSAIAGSLVIHNNDIYLVDMVFQGAAINSAIYPETAETPSIISGNRIYLSASALAVNTNAMWQFGWSSSGDPGYLQAHYKDNVYSGFKLIYSVQENQVNNGLVLSGVEISGERTVSSQAAFSWYVAGNHGLMPLQSINPDGTKTWLVKSTPQGGVLSAGDQIVTKNAGIPSTQICTTGGAISGGAYNAGTTYQPNSWVTASDSGVYRSLASSVGNDPTTSPSLWQKMANGSAVLI